MTDLMFADVVVATALTAAETAAEAAGVRVREVAGVAEQAAVVDLLSQIWGRGPENPAVPPELLRALGKAGNYIAGAFAGDDLVGATIGFHSAPDRHALHSHIAGVAPSHIGRSVGFAMKLHQRGWALSRGIDAIEWTFDPLVSRNAYFNIAKLHALPVEYLTNFYGAMSDAINSDGDTDRLLVRWDLRDDDVADAAAGHPPAVSAHGPCHATVAVPDDIQRMRRTDVDAARAWRRTLREQLTAHLESGGRVVGFDRAEGYIIRLGEGITV
ncbi:MULTISPECIES: GNAT family N-acetyltransferase [Microbacterium]|uniref:GNAT family N-acetyltransferase n=1 Tax=Microbacterium wangchenii TaxID=2541726 RepID=A0ABX5STH0_9MICO|nr:MULTISPECIES: GNAT family N-acetyltransferase [Microbacterium]MCK6065096.1 GNAT family N-acetyltransferase [Microbacterium sp. EYE_512]QBR88555.1 GNAT family N-acetyltransferase [Microbacterium wangchenii]TFV82390.1 GNAT family N-acetyltransferase [Microbacterium sp. dk485]TXK20281.1 GNAT family N-acetyltransferase [Microbacterium wangchenii]